MKIPAFIKLVKKCYAEHGRSMPWRSDTNPYYIVVSEIMLQQTQVDRVVSKFESWIKQFPSWQALATASTKDVLAEWSGLGYNRRALYLKRIAEQVTTNKEYGFLLPKNSTSDHLFQTEHFSQLKLQKLQQLPGIGPNTAGSILAFAYNIPYPFIETNVRSVYIHHFFAEVEKAEGKRACKKINDDDIMPFIEKSLSLASKNGTFKNNPREWYWALMDYGSYLKKNIPNPSRNSAHHVKQSKFKGSNRELRGKIVKLMTKQTTRIAIEKQLNEYPAKLVRKNIEKLIKEGFVL